MSELTGMTDDLRAHLAVIRELLHVVEREHLVLRSGAEYAAATFAQLRKNLLPRLDESLLRLKFHRVEWQQLPFEVRQRHPEVASLLRQNQELAMKILVLDRENEQALLRRGLLPASQLPSVNRERPHYVADLYRRHHRP